MEERRAPPWELCVLLLQGPPPLYRGRGEVEPPWDTPPQGAAAKEVGQGGPAATPPMRPFPKTLGRPHGPLSNKGGRLPPNGLPSGRSPLRVGWP